MRRAKVRKFQNIAKSFIKSYEEMRDRAHSLVKSKEKYKPESILLWKIRGLELIPTSELIEIHREDWRRYRQILPFKVESDTAPILDGTL